jgi:phytol kinase
MNNVFGLIVSAAFIVLILLAARVFEKAGKEASRKFIHIMLSNWWIIAMVFFTNPWVAALMPAIFVVINYASYKMDIIKVMERDEGEENKESLGTVYYAVSLFVLALITFGPVKNPLIGLCGIAVMGYGDGLAAVIGQAVKSPKFKIKDSTKTIAGSLTMFFITLLIMAGFLQYSGSSYVAIKSIASAIILTVVEAVSIKGTDNLTVPLLTSLLAFLLV